MGNTHQEASDSVASRGTIESPGPLGASAGRPSEMKDQQTFEQTLAAFDPQQWMLTPPRRAPWKKRASVGAAAGMIGLLGWIGGKQLQPNIANAANDVKVAEAKENDSQDDILLEQSEPAGLSAPDALVANPFEIIEIEEPATPVTPASTPAAETLAEDPFAPASAGKASKTGTPGTTSKVKKLNGGWSQTKETSSEPVAGKQGRASRLLKPKASPGAPESVPAQSKLTVDSAPPVDFGVVETPAATVEVGEAEGAIEAWGSFSTAQTEPAVNEQPAAASQVQGVAFEEGAPAEAGGFEAVESPAPEPPNVESSAFGGFELEEAAPARPEYSQFAEQPSAEPEHFDAPAASQIAPGGPGNSPTDERVHVVQSGENYWTIARQYYSEGRYFNALAEYNKPRIKEARLLKPGMKVLIPKAGLLDATYPKMVGAATAAAKTQAGLFFDAEGAPLYRVGAGDSLSRIAQYHLGQSSRWEEIYKLNQETLSSPESLKLGAILRMPADASKIQTASAESIRR